MERFYLAPYGPGYVPARPQANASKVILYINGPDELCSAVRANPWKNWCLTYAKASESVHLLVQADSEITLIPFWDSGGNYLMPSATVAQIAEPHRTNIANWLEAKYIPTDWISGSTTIGQILKYVMQILFTVQKLRDDFPEYNLSSTVGDIPAAKRNRIRQWMENNGIDISDIDNAWTIRRLLQRIVTQFGWGPIVNFGVSLL